MSFELEEKRKKDREYQRLWVKRNPEKSRKYHKQWYDRNKEKAKEYRDRARTKQRKARKTVSGWIKWSIPIIKRRAKQLNVPFNLTHEDIEILFPRDGLCPITGRKLVLETFCDDSPSLDRIIPGCGYVKNNVAIISFYANRIKQNCSDPKVFYRLADWLESHTGSGRK